MATAEATSKRLFLATALTAGVFLLELGGGIAAHSLALMSDAAHVFMDVVALAVGWIATGQARRPATERQTFGFARLEMIAALANGGLLVAVTVVVAIEAVHRFAQPQLPSGQLMWMVALAGLSVNALIARSLRAHATNLNVRAALLHVLSDALGACAVVAGGALIALTGAAWIDPTASLLICGIILWGVIGIAREAIDVLLESAPAHAAIENVRATIRGVTGVAGVHDLHVWTLGSESYVLSAHVVLGDSRISEATAILRAIEQRMRDVYGIGHTTVQFECESCEAEDRIICTRTQP